MIKDFHISPYNLSALFDKINKLDPTRKWVCNVRERQSKRSIDQNARYWKLITEFGAYLGYDKDEMHDLCRFKFLRDRVIVGDEPMPRLKSTTRLTTAEMVDYQEAIERWAAGLGFVFDE